MKRTWKVKTLEGNFYTDEIPHGWYCGGRAYIYDPEDIYADEDGYVFSYVIR